MKSLSPSRLLAVSCALTIPLCAIAIRPGVETGIGDDWSYIKTAQVLAQTGHIVYNGWATAMLGWQLLLAALFIKLFGFSFTVVRATTWVIAMTTAFLVHRSFVRVGISHRNATIGTLTLMLSPVLLPMVFIFMTDIGGLFCIVLCLYACLRALQAETSRAADAWIVFAVLSNAVGGTVRQIAWLGALVMVPCTLWLLRRRHRNWIAGGISWAISIALIFVSMRWFAHQPYSVPEPLLRGPFSRFNPWYFKAPVTATLLDISFFVLPLLLMFAPAAERSRRTLAIILAGTMAGIGAGLFLYHRPQFVDLLFPYLGANVSITGLIDGSTLHGERPVLLSRSLRMLLSIVNFEGLLFFAAFLLNQRPHRISSPIPDRSISDRRLVVLTVPFTAAYAALVLSRIPYQPMYDRYLFPLLFIAIMALLRLYQDRISDRLPAASLLLVLLFAGYAVAGTHDTFAMYRARLAAANELRAAGIPATSIDGGIEYNGWTQIEQKGYANELRIRVPANAYVPAPPHIPGACYPLMDVVTPVVDGRYALSFDPNACHGKTSYAPVSYQVWLGPSPQKIYIVDASHP